MSAPNPRATYHHGDLRNALIRAGAELAEQGGPDAVGVRAAARAVGVSPTAAYRHFENGEELLEAVKERAIQNLLDAVRTALESVPDTGDAGETAARRLEMLGRTYVRVALADPGLFRVAFSEKGAIPAEQNPESLDLVAKTLDDLVAAGRMPAERRPMGEIAAWAAVHGFARLILDGPLSQFPEAALTQALDRVIDMVIRGFTAER